MSIKVVRILSVFFVFTLFPLVQAKECSLNFNEGHEDCIACQGSLNAPSSKVESTLHQLVNFVTKADEDASNLRKLKVMESFLKVQENSLNCSNYQTVAKEFNKEFSAFLSSCEKGPDALGRHKEICGWALPTYNTMINASFSNFWKDVEKKEELAKTLRAHKSWCNKMNEQYFKQRLFLDCGLVNELVNDLNIREHVRLTLERDMKEDERPSSAETDRTEVSKNVCDRIAKDNKIPIFAIEAYIDKCL
ncbi:MAG: hypothetical protein ACXVLQ_07695 [Bacteriovorax sp.]